MITVVGIGSLGSKTTTALLKLGIDHLQIIDFDVVEAKNIGPQILYDYSQIGLYKTVAAKQTISKLYPQVQITTVQTVFEARSGMEFLKFSDLVLDCSDNLQTRLCVDTVAYAAKKPWIYAGIKGSAGQIMLFDYKNYSQTCHRFETLFGSSIPTIEAVNDPETTSKIAQIQADFAFEYLHFDSIKSANLVIVMPGKVLRLRV